MANRTSLSFQSLQSFPSLKSFYHPRIVHVPTGFTLVEILVAVAIFMILMSGLALLFTGSLRAVRQSNMQMDAFDRADTALQVIKNDLVTAFSSTEHGDTYTFYGTPTGMTFIGTVKASADPNSEVNIARITYVIYNNWRNRVSTEPDFPEFLVGEGEGEGEGEISVPGYAYKLIRYVEPGVGDLESFPVKWDQPIPDWSGDLPQTVIDQSWIAARTAGMAPECEPDFIKAKKCELWIRMLGGGDKEVPNAWEYPQAILGWPLGVTGDPDDYVVTENIISPVDPGTKTNPGTWPTLFYIDPDFARNVLDPAKYPTYSFYSRYFRPFFDYDTAYPTTLEDRVRIRLPGPVLVPAFNSLLDKWQWSSAWWNDYRSLNCDQRLEWRQDMTGIIPIVYCENVRLPQVINATFTLMFEAKDLNSSNFNRQFSIQVNPPAAYHRDEY